MDIVQSAQQFCSCCGTVVVYNDGTPPHNINIVATTNALIQRVSNGSMAVIKGDCPLEDMFALIDAETKYTVVQFLRCQACGNMLFWGVCIRGAPVYKVSDEEAVYNWRW